MKNAHVRTCKKTKVYIYLYISPYENVCIYIYSRFQKRFHMERYIDIYILLLSCTCARAFVTCYCPTCEKPRFNDKFFLRRVFCSNLKRTCCFAFFFLEKCMSPAIQICNDAEKVATIPKIVGSFELRSIYS